MHCMLSVFHFTIEDTYSQLTGHIDSLEENQCTVSRHEEVMWFEGKVHRTEIFVETVEMFS